MDMTNLMDSSLFHVLLLGTIVGEFLLPWILKHFYKGYDSKTMAMSALGSPESPVRWVYNVWLVWLGVFLLFVSVLLFQQVRKVSVVLAVCTFFSVAVFAIGAGILSGLFSVNASRETITTASQIHGAGAAIGFMTLLFFPLLQSIFAFRCSDPFRGIICSFAFVLSMLFFVFFIMGDKDAFRDTVFSYEGLWERLSLFCMYIPFLHMALAYLIQS
jgi:hypothetical membrane protein